MIRIHFVNGNTKDLDYEFLKLTQKLPYLQVKVWRPENGIAFPIGWDGIMMVEDLGVDEETAEIEAEKEIEKILKEEAARIESEMKSKEEQIPEFPKRETTEEQVEENIKKTAQEKADEKLAEMKEMSECPHEEHDMYFSEMKRYNKKSGEHSITKRYFPVCAKCGVREKFVKSANLPDEVKAEAKLWDK